MKQEEVVLVLFNWLNDLKSRDLLILAGFVFCLMFALIYFFLSWWTSQDEVEEVAPISEPEQSRPVEQATENFSYSASQPEAYMEPEQVVDQIVRDAEQNQTPAVAEPASISDEQHPGPYTWAIVAEDDEKEKAPVIEDFQKYIVQPGDSLGKISSKIFGTTTRWKDIAHINGITNPKLLKVGMTLKIPVEW